MLLDRYNKNLQAGLSFGLTTGFAGLNLKIFLNILACNSALLRLKNKNIFIIWVMDSLHSTPPLIKKKCGVLAHAHPRKKKYIFASATQNVQRYGHADTKA